MKTNIEQYKVDWEDIYPSNELNQRLRKRIFNEVDNMENKKNKSDLIEMNFNEKKSKKNIFIKALAACIIVALIIAGGAKMGLFNKNDGKRDSTANDSNNDSVINTNEPEATSKAEIEEAKTIDTYLKCDVDKEYKYDLDGDGQEDTIKCITKEVLMFEETQTYEYDITIYINDTSYNVHQYEGYLENYFYIMDLNCTDKYLEIGVVSPGPSDDPITEVLIYDNNKITSSGTVQTYPDSFKYNKDGTFEVSERFSILQTMYAYVKNRINDEHKIVFEKQKLIYPDKIDLELLVDLNVYKEADEKSEVIEVSPQACYFDICDISNNESDSDWLHLKFNDGSGGWIKVKDDYLIAGMEDIDANSIFKGLYQCD